MSSIQESLLKLDTTIIKELKRNVSNLSRNLILLTIHLKQVSRKREGE
jgi:archaellum component FlaC